MSRKGEVPYPLFGPGLPAIVSTKPGSPGVRICQNGAARRLCAGPAAVR